MRLDWEQFISFSPLAGENYSPNSELSGSTEDYSSGTDAQRKSVFSRELHHTF